MDKFEKDEDIEKKLSAGLTIAPTNNTQELEGFFSKWNWGAALLVWIWGVFHRKYGYSLLFFILTSIPIIGIIAFIVGFILFGKKGNKWAWESKTWNSLEHCITTQEKWSKWGIGITVAMIIVFTFLYVHA